MTLDTKDAAQMAENPDAGAKASTDLLLGAIGAIAGGAVGHFLFRWVASQGLYAIALPGALVGLGCAALSARRSVPLGILCGVLGLIVQVYTEWRVFPFIADDSLSYFLAHVYDITGISMVAIVLGTILACWFGTGREGGSWPRQRTVRYPRD